MSKKTWWLKFTKNVLKSWKENPQKRPIIEHTKKVQTLLPSIDELQLVMVFISHRVWTLCHLALLRPLSSGTLSFPGTHNRSSVRLCSGIFSVSTACFPSFLPHLISTHLQRSRILSLALSTLTFPGVYPLLSRQVTSGHSYTNMSFLSLHPVTYGHQAAYVPLPLSHLQYGQSHLHHWEVHPSGWLRFKTSDSLLTLFFSFVQDSPSVPESYWFGKDFSLYVFS